MEKKYKITLTVCYILLMILVPLIIIGIINKKAADVNEETIIKFDINQLAADETVFISEDNKYARLNFRILESEEIIVTIKALTYDAESLYKTGMIQSRLRIEDNKIVVINTKSEDILEIYFKNNYIEIINLTQDSEFYSGKYYIKDDTIEYVNLLPSDKYSGIYINETNPDKEVTVLYDGKDEKGNDLVRFSAYIYSDKVFIRNLSDGSTFVNGDDAAIFFLEEGKLMLAFSDNKIKINLFDVKNGEALELDSPINGEYIKQKGFLVKELEEILAGNDCYDNYCENKQY